MKEDASEDSTDIVVKRGESTVPLPEGERSPRRKASLKKKAKKSKRNKWLLAAAVGSSGYVDSFLNTDMSYGDASSPGDMNNSAGSPIRISRIKNDDEKESGNTPPQTVSFRNAPVLRSSKVDENFLDNRSFESYPDVSYSLPISFGFTVRKDLSRRIAWKWIDVYVFIHYIQEGRGLPVRGEIVFALSGYSLESGGLCMEESAMECLSLRRLYDGEGFAGRV